ncbi:MAG: DNA alkylation repair protein [Actinomycetota bacterium]|nr:DNA alkylation repair protein [Actinomycetota bacterium]
MAAFVATHPELAEAELKALACELITQPLSKDKLAGVLLLSEHLVDRPAWMTCPCCAACWPHLGDWNVCDWFCVKVLARMLERSDDPQRLAGELIAWTASEDLWVRLAGLVAFVELAPRGDAAMEGLTRRLIEGAGRNVADRRLRPDQRGLGAARAGEVTAGRGARIPRRPCRRHVGRGAAGRFGAPVGSGAPGCSWTTSRAGYPQG